VSADFGENAECFHQGWRGFLFDPPPPRFGSAPDAHGARPNGRYHDVVPLDAVRRFRQEILEVAARHGARNVRVFGSIARGDDRPDSDVDFLVDVDRGRSLLDVIALEQDLQQLLGRHVSVLTDGGLSPYLQQRILAEAFAL
jgi:hypothetical protein